METSLQHLIDVLSEQLRLMEDMSRCLAAEREAVISGDRQTLDREVAQKEKLIQRIKAAEERRQRQVETVSAGLGITDGKVTLEKLAEVASPAWQDRLRDCRDELRGVIGRVQAANQSNHTLVSQSLALVQGSLVMLGNISPDRGTYGAEGKLDEPSRPGRLLKGHA